MDIGTESEAHPRVTAHDPCPTQERMTKFVLQQGFILHHDIILPLDSKNQQFGTGFEDTIPSGVHGPRNLQVHGTPNKSFVLRVGLPSQSSVWSEPFLQQLPFLARVAELCGGYNVTELENTCAGHTGKEATRVNVAEL